ncbi:MAG: response regulator [Lachnospiraceae bacterium]|nr:response regulator [Lachnospiraceae bacterium]
MNRQTIEHYLIEDILSLLSILEDNNMDIYLLMENKTRLPAFLDAKNIQAAYEVIKFMDEMPGGFLIYQANESEKILYTNKALIRMFQCCTRQDFRELTGNSFRGIVHPDDLESVEQSIAEQIAASQYDLDYVEYRIIRKDGQIRWIEDYGHFVHTRSVGDIFYVFLGDATEKKIRLLAEKNAFLEVIEGLSLNYESILYVDLDTDQILPYRLSRRIKPLFESPRPTRDFCSYTTEYENAWVLPEDREALKKATSPEYIRQKLSGSKTYYINYRISEKEEQQYLQLRIVNVGKTGNVSQVVMGYRRIDDEIQREMEQNQILEEALGNANLAITAKNTFLSNMSHDMRTPLNAIFGYARLAKQNLHDTEAAMNYLNRIETASRQLLDMIEKVLEISWTEANDFPLLEDECCLSDLMAEIHRVILPQTADKNISFSVDFAGLTHPNVYCDQDKLKQILLYLANNAVTYTKNDGRISISAAELKNFPNGYAVYQFAVEDTGIGIGKDFLGHIFEPFEREKNTTFSGVHGSGLGLTIARNLVERMGGTIEVSSNPGQGSTFTVTLRFRMQKQLHSMSVDADMEFPLPKNQKILLVEDNELNMEIETEILKSLGFLVEPAGDGSVALEKIKNSKLGEYALVLTDIQMPILDGWQTALAIRRLENPALSHIPIIALSANAFESDRSKSIECGIDAHLTKPVDVPLLVETIKKTLQKHQL